MELNNKLSQLRKNKGLTQLELAEALNVSRQAVSRWEVGTAVPTLDNLVALSRLYSVPLDDLVRDEREKPSEQAVRLKANPHGLVRQTALALCLIAVGALIAAAAFKLYRNYRVRKSLEHTVILNIGGVRSPGYIISESPGQFQDGEIKVPLAPYDPDKPDAYIEKPDGTYEEFPLLDLDRYPDNHLDN